MVFTRFVEVGRVAVVTYGENLGKPVVIIDIIDQSRALVDGPSSGVKRQQMPFRRMQLTDFVIKIPRACKPSVLTRAYEAAEIPSKWANSTYAKKLATREKRANMNDLDRFKLHQARRQRRIIIAKQLKQ